jgi:ABC-type antimicrobial peptide transport system permease subunit
VGVVVNGYLRSQGLVGVSAELPLAIAVAGVVGAGLLAVLAGAIPARRAARLPAREAVEA